MMNKHINFFIGQFAMALSILINHFAKDSDLVSFLIGLSIVCNIAFAWSLRKNQYTDV